MTPVFLSMMSIALFSMPHILNPGGPILISNRGGNPAEEKKQKHKNIEHVLI